MWEILKRIAAVIIAIVVLNMFGLLNLAILLFIIYVLIEVIYRIIMSFKGRDYDDGKRGF